VGYVSFLGDGDSEAFSGVEQLKSHYNDVTISKLGYVCHVWKYMATLLINRLYIRKELLSDGKPKGGNKQVGR
jgi:hypothetical protein